MKITIDIPNKMLKEAIKHTGAKTRKEAVLIAVERFNKRKRLEDLSERLHGKFKNFMTQADLRKMREDHRWEAMK